jgi:tRNA(Ile)-lysidine synthase
LLLISKMHQFEAEVLKNLAAVPPKSRLLAAVSGGADSTALLVALSRLSTAGAFPVALSCLHVNHNLRGAESEADAAAVQALAARLAVPCRVQTLEKDAVGALARLRGCGTEAAARELRHSALRDEAARVGAAYILVAHTQADALENVLLRVLRGAGPAGLAALPRENGALVRPLITLSRRAVLAYLAGAGERFQTDSTNESDMYLRNRVRRHLVPVLDEHFPNWRKNIEALAATQREAADYLAGEARRVITERGKKMPDGTISIQDFVDFPLILKEEIIFQALDTFILYRDDFDADGGTARSRTVRRAVIRDALRRENDRDIGPALLRFKHGGVSIVPRRARGESGFALVISADGVYRCRERVFTLKGGSLSVDGKPAVPLETPAVILPARDVAFCAVDARGRRIPLDGAL